MLIFVLELRGNLRYNAVAKVKVCLGAGRIKEDTISMTDEQVQKLISSIDTRFDAVDARFDAIDTRFNEIDNRFDAMDARFDAVDARFDAIDTRINTMEATFEARFDSMEEQFNDLYRYVEDRLNKLETKIDSKVDKDRLEYFVSLLEKDLKEHEMAEEDRRILHERIQRLDKRVKLLEVKVA